MNAALLRELDPDRTTLFPWTVELYHRLIDQGILPEGEPYELLDGVLVRKDRSSRGEDPMTVGRPHAYAVHALARLATGLEGTGTFLMTQSPIVAGSTHEPEPDAAVVLGSNNAYRDHHPQAADVLCAIQVADSSLRRDRGVKQRIYAEAGIPQYVIVNLADRVIEQYTVPLASGGEYRHRVIAKPGEVLTIGLGHGRGQWNVPVAEVLP